MEHPVVEILLPPSIKSLQSELVYQFSFSYYPIQCLTFKEYLVVELTVSSVV